MWHVGIDLHREFVVVAGVRDNGEIMEPVKIACRETEAIGEVIRSLAPFRAVIEATGTYRWLYDLLSPHGVVLLAHPFRLRAMIQRRSKTDKLDAQLLANLLRINQIPLAYVPPAPYQQLRDLVRCRVRLGRELAEAKIHLRAMLARQNREPPFRVPFGVRGLAWFGSQDFGPVENLVRDELLARMRHFGRQLTILDRRLVETSAGFPQTRSPLGHPRHRFVLGPADRGRTGRGGTLSHSQTSWRILGADFSRPSVRRPLLSRLDYAARFSLAALGLGASGDEGGPRRRRAAKLLHAGAEAVQRQNRPGSGGQEIGGDLLETFAALATYARRTGGVERKR